MPRASSGNRRHADPAGGGDARPELLCAGLRAGDALLDDYIVGDKYFKIKNAEHNLVRTRCQIALAKDMLLKMDAMNAIVMDCYNRYR